MKKFCSLAVAGGLCLSLATSAVPANAASVVSNGVDASIPTVDVSVPTPFTGMTLQEIYGTQPDGSSSFMESFDMPESEDFEKMVETGELQMLSPGVYLDASGTVTIDVSVPTEYTGMTLEEIYGQQPSDRGERMPTETWSWSSGDYLNHWFSIDHMHVYTNYLFTGYSTLYTETQASRDFWSPALDKYIINLMTGTGTGSVVTSYTINSTQYQTVRWYNLNPATKYAFTITKENDATQLSGTISVKRS